MWVQQGVDRPVGRHELLTAAHCLPHVVDEPVQGVELLLLAPGDDVVGHTPLEQLPDVFGPPAAVRCRGR